METAARTKMASGVPGLDEVLHGGLIPERAYLVRGGPGTGKTIMGWNWLSEGVARGERALFISLGETTEELQANARQLGFAVEGVEILDLSPTPEFFTQVQTYDIFAPAEVERQPTTQEITDAVERLLPQRVFADTMTQFRYLATDDFQFRKQVISFLRFLIERGCTVIFTSETSPTSPDDDLQFIADGVINLEANHRGRFVRVSKYRGSDFATGPHAMLIGQGGLRVIPRLVPQAHQRAFVAEKIRSGIPELDEMLHGGLERGTITIISGPSGVGKTTVGLQFMKEAAGRGERSVVYTFDENLQTMIARSEGVSIPARAMIERETLSIVQVEPLVYTADELADMVRREVEQRNARILMIDSTAGYRLSLRGEDPVSHLHALCRYLGNMGVTTILVTEIESVTGEFRITDLQISYLADNVIFLRYLEVEGHLAKVIGVLKKRTSDFEKHLRELEITPYGIKVGAPMTGLRGILLGISQNARDTGGGEGGG